MKQPEPMQIDSPTTTKVWVQVQAGSILGSSVAHRAAAFGPSPQKAAPAARAPVARGQGLDLKPNPEPSQGAVLAAHVLVALRTLGGLAAAHTGAMTSINTILAHTC